MPSAVPQYFTRPASHSFVTSVTRGEESHPAPTRQRHLVFSTSEGSSAVSTSANGLHLGRLPIEDVGAIEIDSRRSLDSCVGGPDVTQLFLSKGFTENSRSLRHPTHTSPTKKQPQLNHLAA